MRLSQIFTAPNQLTLLRMVFVPFIVIHLVEGRYVWALVVFVVAGFSDGLDGLLARTLHQQTLLGQYLDPIADKLLLSTMFMVLFVTHNIPLTVTVLVFSRDIIIVIVCAVLYATGALRVFRPSWLGKANTVAQIVTVLFVLLHQVRGDVWIAKGRQLGFNVTVALTVLSGVHYIVRVALDLRHSAASKAAESSR